MPSIKDLLSVNEKLSREVIGPRCDEVDQSRRFPRENIQALAGAGLLGLMVPRQYGGSEAGLGELAQSLETIAQYCPSTAMVMLMHHCATGVIVAKGSPELKQRVLPEIADGRHLTTLAFSEAGSGGHFYMPVSQARRNGDGCVLTALKSFVTSAGEADSYVVSTRRPNASSATDVNLYLIPKTAPGLLTQGRFEGLGLAGNASAPMKLEDVAVDEKIRLGEEGSGFQTMLEVALPPFQIGIAAVSLGIAAAAFQAAKSHVSARKHEQAGGTALSAIPRVQFLMGEMALELAGARAYLAETIRRALSGDPQVITDILGVKAKAAEASVSVTGKAMMLGGGRAFGRRGGLERMFRDSQAAAVMAPSSDILKDFVGKTCLGLPLF